MDSSYTTIIVLVLISIFAVIITIFNGKSKNAKKKRELIAFTNEYNGMIDDAESYLAKIKSAKAVPIVKTSVFIDEDETAYYESKADLIELRAVRSSTGTSGGVSIRIAKGVTYYTGTGKRNYESHDEWKRIDTGKFVITDKRILFSGNQTSKAFPMKKIISAKPTSGYEIEIVSNAYKKNVIFAFDNAYIPAIAIIAMKGLKDPKNITENINIELPQKAELPK